MNQDDIIRMAMEVGLYSGNPRTPGTGNMIVRKLERFAALVAEHEAAKWAQGAKVSIPTITMEQEFSFYYRKGYKAGVEAEREACAKASEAQIDRWMDDRARYAASECAKAIRQRGEKE